MGLAVRVYSVKALHHGEIVEVATLDTARHALIRYLDAIERYRRAWVSDEAGNGLAMDDLVHLAQEEERER